jgi:hypothetical protein
VTRVHASPLPPHQSFHFSIVIENIKADFYFSAKLINCFVHATVPVYWGAPSIPVFFNVSGMIVFDTLEEVSGGRLWGWSHACCLYFPRFLALQLDEIVDGLSEDKWLSMLPAVEDNFNRAKRYGASQCVIACIRVCAFVCARSCVVRPSRCDAPAQATTGMFSSTNCCRR